MCENGLVGPLMHKTMRVNESWLVGESLDCHRPFTRGNRNGLAVATLGAN
jgi:hypothetical protein